MNKKKTKSTTQKKKPGAGMETLEDLVGAATSWCAEHHVPTRVLPEHMMRLMETRGLLDSAIAQAGGTQKVPEAVLIYRQMLHEVALATAMHGIKCSMLRLFSGTKR
jgi:hypothetical protein